jgi:hypothetical protein
MHVGILTAPYGREPVEHAIRWAGQHGFKSLEVAVGPGSQHCDIRALLEGNGLGRLKAACQEAGTAITTFSFYANQLHPDAEQRRATNDYLKATIDAASAYGLGVVCTLGGMPLPGKDKLATIREEAAGVYGPLVEHAASKGVKLALENWYATNLQGFDTFDAMFEAVPHPSFGRAHLLRPRQGLRDPRGPPPLRRLARPRLVALHHPRHGRRGLGRLRRPVAHHRLRRPPLHRARGQLHRPRGGLPHGQAVLGDADRGVSWRLSPPLRNHAPAARVHGQGASRRPSGLRGQRLPRRFAPPGGDPARHRGAIRAV